MPRTTLGARDERFINFQTAIDRAKHQLNRETMREMAEYLHIPEATFWRYYRNPEKIPLGVAIRILDKLKVPKEERMKML